MSGRGGAREDSLDTSIAGIEEEALRGVGPDEGGTRESALFSVLPGEGDAFWEGAGAADADAEFALSAPEVSLSPPAGGEGDGGGDGGAAAAAAEEEETERPAWSRQEKGVFVLSTAGKPIYTRYGDEDRMASLFGVMQALVTFVEETDDNLKSLVAGKHTVTFLRKESVILVMASAGGEPESAMVTQLNYIYSQILFVLTGSQVDRIFKLSANYDLRRMLEGTEKFVGNLISLMDVDPSFFLGSVRCLPLPLPTREKVGQILVNARVSDLVFSVLIADGQLISLLRPRKYSLHPADLHLIFNLVSSNSSFKASEGWIPMCLPRFNSTGFLYAHVSYVDEEASACLLLITTNRDGFDELRESRRQIVEELQACDALTHIHRSLSEGSYSVKKIGIPDLRHFLYKHKSIAQFTAPRFEAPYSLPGEQRRLFKRYQFVHARIHSQQRPIKIFFHVGASETLFGFVSAAFELYACFGPLVTKPTAIGAVLQLIRWMKPEKDGLFITSSLVF